MVTGMTLLLSLVWVFVSLLPALMSGLSCSITLMSACEGDFDFGDREADDNSWFSFRGLTNCELNLPLASKLSVLCWKLFSFFNLDTSLSG